MTEITLFLPSAGLGERLRPITGHIPKPLLPVLGRALIGIILDKLTAVCSGRIGINLHYKAEMIRRWVEASPYAERVALFPEDPILGTGGALKNAEAFLSRGPFLVHNSDILLDIDFSRLIEAHLSSGAIATLVTHRHPTLSNVVIDEDDRVIDVENPGESRPDPARVASKAAYTGIAVYSPDILRFLPDGVSHATVAWLNAAAAGRAVQTLDVTGSFWNDIGTPATYAAGIFETLRREGETLYRSPSAVCGQIETDGYLVSEYGSEIASGSRLRNCIVMPGARVSGFHENRIIGPDYSIGLTELEMQPQLSAAEQKTVPLSDPLFAGHLGRGSGRYRQSGHEATKAILIGFGGSDRRYYRVRVGRASAILMECGADHPDFDRHLSYTRFFASIGIPVPKLLASDEAHKRALFEDLGDTSLYTFLKLPRDERQVEQIYQQVIDILATLHTRAVTHIDECPLLRTRLFDYDHLRWETRYFLEQFVSGLRGMTVPDPAAIEEEFHRLGSVAAGFPKTVVHRDFQSQNIMITQGPVARVIDYQGARIGPPAYDLASILWDPYHRLEEEKRERLLARYISQRKAGEKTFSGDDFRETVLPCRLQRHMQALGAYAFLSRVKGKRYFLRHVEEGLRLLKEDAALAQGDFPALSELIERL